MFSIRLPTSNTHGAVKTYLYHLDNVRSSRSRTSAHVGGSENRSYECAGHLLNNSRHCTTQVLQVRYKKVFALVYLDLRASRASDESF